MKYVKLFEEFIKEGNREYNTPEFKALEKANAKVAYFLAKNRIKEKDLSKYYDKLEQLAGDYAYALDGFLEYYYHSEDVVPDGTPSKDYFKSLL